jgi:hypothetical protein
MGLSLIQRPSVRGFVPFWLPGSAFGGSRPLFLPRHGVSHGGFQTIEHVPYAVEEILHHEARFHVRERHVLDCIEVQAQYLGRRMGIDDGDAKAEKRMYLTGDEVYVLGFLRIIRHGKPSES